MVGSQGFEVLRGRIFFSKNRQGGGGVVIETLGLRTHGGIAGF